MQQLFEKFTMVHYLLFCMIFLKSSDNMQYTMHKYSRIRLQPQTVCKYNGFLDPGTTFQSTNQI